MDQIFFLDVLNTTGITPWIFCPQRNNSSGCWKFTCSDLLVWLPGIIQVDGSVCAKFVCELNAIACMLQRTNFWQIDINRFLF